MTDFLFKNVNVLTGDQLTLESNMNVLIKDNTIDSIFNSSIDETGLQIIEGLGMTLMPGLIDAHAHITGLNLSPKNITYSPAEVVTAEINYLTNSLMFGFTSLREAGGADYAIASLLKSQKIKGPRLFYSGNAITQTGGGADFRTPQETLDPCGHIGPFSVMSTIADGVDQVRHAAREELRKGASQIKVFASGGVVFPSVSHSTLYEYSEEELRAIVEEAKARDTYVMAHVYTDEGVKRCLNAGVRSIEHGNFMLEETVKLVATHNAFLNPTFISLVQRIESASLTHLPSDIVENLKITIEKGKQVYQWAKKYNVAIGFGTDLWGPEAQKEQLREFEIRKTLDTARNILRSATSINAELLMQKGKLGVIQPGASADLLIVNGNPLEDLDIMLEPTRNLKLIMKEGVIYKNEL